MQYRLIDHRSFTVHVQIGFFVLRSIFLFHLSKFCLLLKYSESQESIDPSRFLHQYQEVEVIV